MAVASITEVTKAVTAAINAATAATWTATLDDDRRSTGEIQHAIVSADADVVLAILDTPGHPQRSGYMAACSPSLSHGDELPDSIGEYGPVEIDIAGTSAWITGTPANADDIDLIRRNPNSMFGTLLHNQAASPLGGYYHILRPKIFFTGTLARIWVGAFTPNYTTPACFAPEQYTQAIVALAVARLMKEGDQPDVFAANTLRGAYYLDLIRQKQSVLAVVEETQKAVG